MYTLFFCGCCKDDTGISGCGAVLYNEIDNEIDNEIWTGNHYIGYNTIHGSEYIGLIIGLTQVVAMGIKELVVKGDILIINQMKYDNSTKMFTYYNKAKKLEGKIENVTFIHVERDENKRAFELANLALNYI
jgi:ribonuclease HI